MNKCEWENGKFVPCSEFNGVVNRTEPNSFNSPYICEICESDIRKPEPEKPLIVKSGGTWVAHFEGVDYLCIHPERWHGVAKDIEQSVFIERIEQNSFTWKPFSEITLDDEIAKLRPTIKYGDRLFILFAVWDNVIYTNKDDYWMNNFADIVRLATPKELQGLSK